MDSSTQRTDLTHRLTAPVAGALYVLGIDLDRLSTEHRNVPSSRRDVGGVQSIHGDMNEE